MRSGVPPRSVQRTPVNSSHSSPALPPTRSAKPSSSMIGAIECSA